MNGRWPAGEQKLTSEGVTCAAAGQLPPDQGATVSNFSAESPPYAKLAASHRRIVAGLGPAPLARALICRQSWAGPGLCYCLRVKKLRLSGFQWLGFGCGSVAPDSLLCG